jgi:decaprenyl-phosphate phosphoribosyltransferase
MVTGAQSSYVKMPYHLLKAMRPHHWVKNLVVFAAPLFALRLDLSSFSLALMAFLAFSLTASGFYLINDSLDVKADREHPIKRKRPIAAGLVPIPIAMMAALTCFAASAAISINTAPMLGALVGGYALIQLGYNAGLKREPIIDIMCISMGFVLRALGGAVAVGVPASAWFILCIGLLAFYLGVEKRKAELVSIGDKGTTRAVLREYTLPWLMKMESAVTATTLMSYALWTVDGAKTPWMLATIPFVAYGIFKYQSLTEKGEGEAPEKTLFTNPYILLTVVSWGLVSNLILLFTR